MVKQEESVVTVSNLVKTYADVTAVAGISFNVYRGEIFGMLGPNGAGKTTLIECLEGLRQPDGGVICVLGRDPQRDGYWLRQHIGVQFQSAALPDRLKVWEALDLFAAFYQRAVAWDVLLAQTGLDDKRNAYVNNLSGGQQQRLFIALALLNNPELIFLDELTTGLDPRSRRDMWALVRGIRDQGRTVFLTTHFMEEAERLCDRVGIIDNGRLIALDTPRNLINALNTEKRVVFEVEEPLDVSALQALPPVIRVERLSDQVIVYGRDQSLPGAVVNVLDEQGVHFHNLRSEQPTLEDVFLSLTGKHILN